MGKDDAGRKNKDAKSKDAKNKGAKETRKTFLDIIKPFFQPAAETTEALLDAGVASELGKAIPVGSTIAAIYTSQDKVRGAIFAHKIEKFLTESERRVPEAAAKFRKKVSGKPDEAARLGRVLAHVVDRSTEDDKPQIIARVFVGFLEGRITEEDLRRVLFAIDSAFVDDLNRLLDWNMGTHPSHGKDWIPFLAPSGFATVVVDTRFDSSDVRYVLTPLAHLFRTAVDD